MSNDERKEPNFPSEACLTGATCKAGQASQGFRMGNATLVSEISTGHGHARTRIFQPE